MKKTKQKIETFISKHCGDRAVMYFRYAWVISWATILIPVWCWIIPLIVVEWLLLGEPLRDLIEDVRIDYGLYVEKLKKSDERQGAAK